VIDLIGFGMRLQAIRESRDMTQEQLAGKSGLSAHYIGNLEQGIRNPSSTSLLKLCHALGTTPNDLLQDSLSEEMLKGLCVDISHATTLRDALHIFERVLSDYLCADDEVPEVLGIAQNQADPILQEPEADTLSALLLRMAQETNPTL